MFGQYLKNYSSILNSIYRIKSHLLPPRKKQLFFLLLLMVGVSFAEAMSLASIVPFIGVFINPEIFYSHPWLNIFVEFFEITNNDELFFLVTIIFVSLVIISFVIKLFFTYLSNKIQFLTEADFKIIIFNNNINQSYSYHLKQSSNVVLSSLIQKTQFISNYMKSFLDILVSLMISISIFVVLLLIEPTIILTIGSIIIIFFVSVSSFKKRKILKNSEEITKAQDNIISIFQDSVGYVGEIILYSLHNIFISKFNKFSHQIAKNFTFNKNVGESPRIYLEYISLICLAILILIFNQNKSELATNLTMIAALALGAQKILPLVNRVHTSLINLRAGQFILDDALNLLDLSKKENIDNTFSEKIFLKKSIKLSNIFFSYNKNDNWILKNINLEIKKGSTIAITGPTGCGKSTLGNIIIGLLDPTKGQLFIDDILINFQNKTAWQKNISIIPQSIFLNDVSIAENIAIGVDPKKINLEKVKNVAKQARVADFIESIPSQYEEKVGERGIRLSGGQRQRIGIARALYREAKIILFDEATNQLDTDTESSVMQSINNLNKEITIIFIAHRLSTLKNCDQIIDLAKL